MTYGLTTNGFVKKDFNTIKEEIEESLNDELAQPLNYEAPSVIGSIVSVLAVHYSEIWDLLESVYNSQYLTGAEGHSLDGVCDYIGIRRLQATYTNVTAQLTAVNNTQIDANSEALIKLTNDIFYLSDTVTISNENCYSIKFNVNEDEDEEITYSITINTYVVTYDKKLAIEQELDEEGNVIVEEQIADSLQDISIALVDLLNNDENISVLILAEYTDGNIVITTKDKAFICYISQNIEIVDVTSNGIFIAQEAGKILAPTNSLTIINSAIEGWEGVSNAEAGIVGNNLETDIELRRRLLNSLQFAGSSTVNSIKSHLLNLQNVTAVSLTENQGSIEVLVTGGDDEEIAKTIWERKSAGILTIGNTTKFITDSTGNTQEIHFSRPVLVYIYAKIIITATNLYNEEYNTQIKKDIVDYINSLGVSSTIVYQKLIQLTFKTAINGVVNITVSVGSNEVEELPELISSNIILEETQSPITDIGKIEIEVV